jgi:YgiT-type zinc finger domain-containing protein
MTRHTHDQGELVERHVDHDYVVHHRGDEPGLLVVTGVPASVCDVCDEHWFDDVVGFALSRLLQEHEPGPGEIRTVEWARSYAA